MKYHEIQQWIVIYIYIIYIYYIYIYIIYIYIIYTYIIYIYIMYIYIYIYIQCFSLTSQIARHLCKENRKSLVVPEILRTTNNEIQRSAMIRGRGLLSLEHGRGTFPLHPIAWAPMMFSFFSFFFFVWGSTIKIIQDWTESSNPPQKRYKRSKNRETSLFSCFFF